MENGASKEPRETEGEIAIVQIWVRLGGASMRGHPKPDGLRGEPLFRFVVPASCEPWIRERSEAYREGSAEVRVFCAKPPDPKLSRREQSAYWTEHEVRASPATIDDDDDDEENPLARIPAGADPGSVLQAQLASLAAQVGERRRLLEKQETVYREILNQLKADIAEVRGGLAKARQESREETATLDGQLKSQRDFVFGELERGRVTLREETKGTLEGLETLIAFNKRALAGGLNRRSAIAEVRAFIREPNALPLVESMATSLMAATLTRCGFNQTQTQETIDTMRQGGLQAAYRRGARDILEIVARLLGDEEAEQVFAEFQRQAAAEP